MITFLNDRDTVITENVTSSPSTIHTASASNTLYITQSVTVDGVVTYINCDRVIEAFDEDRGIIVMYDSERSAPQKLVVTSPDLATFVGANQNTLALTLQKTGQIKYINNLLINKVVSDAIDTMPVIDFTTKVKTGAGGVDDAGSGYTAPTVSITGGGGSGAAGTLTTFVLDATVVDGGTGGTPGAVTITGTTGTGTKFQATGVIDGGGILSGALVITVDGNYSVPVTDITAEPVTGGSLVGATVSVDLAILAFTVTSSGTGYDSYPTFEVVDETGVDAVIYASMVVESPLVIVDGGSDINTAVTLTFTAGTATATATATVDAVSQSVTATSLTAPGEYSEFDEDIYPTLAITGGAGCFVFYDNKTTGDIKIQVAETKSTVQSAINAL